jgi:hypothetical protein
MTRYDACLGKLSSYFSTLQCLTHIEEDGVDVGEIGQVWWVSQYKITKRSEGLLRLRVTYKINVRKY